MDDITFLILLAGVCLLVIFSPLIWSIIRNKFSGPAPSYFTIDGGYLCPYPGMTDEELYDFESDMDMPRSQRTWPTLEDYLTRQPKTRAQIQRS